ncbi:transposase [Paenibacillus uliginis N3/975]|uniref:Transposase n=1 Tax=Paenibacillus uliginis N3/975 TaxID=1313296 RepID=A0A1X7HPP1_9BACL|nr:transposase [Paenibacillus uliginis]SMF89956.1 transposase [Paenibacillus uliginis N3/975]
MGEQRQRYNEEFKRQTVKYIQEQTKSVADVCVELNIPKSTVNQWIAKYREFDQEPLAAPEKVRELQQQLKEQEKANKLKEREIEDLQEELAILKKALHIFSKEPN